jgi:hypothetical protein
MDDVSRKFIAYCVFDLVNHREIEIINSRIIGETFESQFGRMTFNGEICGQDVRSLEHITTHSYAALPTYVDDFALYLNEEPVLIYKAFFVNITKMEVNPNGTSAPFIRCLNVLLAKPPEIVFYDQSFFVIAKLSRLWDGFLRYGR